MDQVAPPFRKALALTLLFAVMFLAVTQVVVPVAASFAAYGESIERSQMLLDRYRRLAGSEAEVKARYEALRKDARRAGLFLGAPSVELAAATLQARIGNTARVSGVRLASIQMLPATPAGDMVRISARVAMTASPDGLTRLLHNLETSPPYLFIDRIRISTRSASGQGPDAEAATAVQAQFDISGFNVVGKQ